VSLWEEYEHAASPEAQAVKALDELETLLQHTQGANPSDFDSTFNLGYGRRYTDATPVFGRCEHSSTKPPAAGCAVNHRPAPPNRDLRGTP